MITREDEERIAAFKAKYKNNPDAAMREIEQSIANMRMNMHDTHNRFVYEKLQKDADAVSPADEREMTK